MLRFSRLPRFSRALVTLFFVAGFLSPIQFVAIAPGTPQGIFPEIVSLPKVSNAKSYPVDGQFYLLTIRITAPGSYVPGIEMLYRWARTDQVVLPTSVIYPPGLTLEEEEKQSTAEMKGSQDYARTVALEYLERTFPDRGFEKLTSRDISIAVKRTGGPSGGMIFTLAIIEMLTKENLLQGR